MRPLEIFGDYLANEKVASEEARELFMRVGKGYDTAARYPKEIEAIRRGLRPLYTQPLTKDSFQKIAYELGLEVEYPIVGDGTKFLGLLLLLCEATVAMDLQKLKDLLVVNEDTSFSELLVKFDFLTVISALALFGGLKFYFEELADVVHYVTSTVKPSEAVDKDEEYYESELARVMTIISTAEATILNKLSSEKNPAVRCDLLSKKAILDTILEEIGI